MRLTWTRLAPAGYEGAGETGPFRVEAQVRQHTADDYQIVVVVWKGSEIVGSGAGGSGSAAGAKRAVRIAALDIIERWEAAMQRRAAGEPESDTPG